jgi:hypothetical protein
MRTSPTYCGPPTGAYTNFVVYMYVYTVLVLEILIIPILIFSFVILLQRTVLIPILFALISR